MSVPTGHTIKQIILGEVDGKEFLRFDLMDEDGTAMFAWNLEDCAKWLQRNYVDEECPVIDCRVDKDATEENVEIGMDYDDDEPDLDPVWADSDALASAGWGTDEDYS